MPAIVTPATDIVANDTTTDLWNVLTGPIDTTQLKNVLFGVELYGNNLIQAKVGVQFSSDLATWDTVQAVNIAGGYTSSEGWKYSSVTNVFSLASPKLFCRIGLLATTTSGTANRCARARLMIQPDQMQAQTRVFGNTLVHSDGTVTAIFVPVSGTMSADAFRGAEFRTSFEMQTSTGNIAMCPAIQESEDGITWSGSQTLGDYISSNGITYGTTFATLGTALSKRYVRFGYLVKNSTAGIPEGCRAQMRVDWR